MYRDLVKKSPLPACSSHGVRRATDCLRRLSRDVEGTPHDAPRARSARSDHPFGGVPHFNLLLSARANSIPKQPLFYERVITDD